MSKKLIVALLLLGLVSVAVGLTAFASPEGKEVVINQQIAGSIFGGIEVTSSGATVNRSLLNLYAKGGPGEANIEAVGGAIPRTEPSGLCPEETTDLELKFIDGGFVETFNDLSMLFYSIDTSPDAKNALCVDFQGTNSGVWDYVIVGGAGRFEGATGAATVKVGSTWRAAPELTAESGTLQGTIQLP